MSQALRKTEPLQHYPGFETHLPDTAQPDGQADGSSNFERSRSPYADRTDSGNRNATSGTGRSGPEMQSVYVSKTSPVFVAPWKSRVGSLLEIATWFALAALFTSAAVPLVNLLVSTNLSPTSYSIFGGLVGAAVAAIMKAI
jgi:hypothetical protein